MTDPLVAVVLVALAGVRTGQRVAVVGAGARTTSMLLAGSGSAALVDDAADVVVAGAPYDVPRAALLLAPGGRLVALAADAGAARRIADGAGLRLRHVEAVGHQVAWSAVRPLTAPPGAEPVPRGTLDA